MNNEVDQNRVNKASLKAADEFVEGLANSYRELKLKSLDDEGFKIAKLFYAHGYQRGAHDEAQRAKGEK